MIVTGPPVSDSQKLADEAEAKATRHAVDNLVLGHAVELAYRRAVSMARLDDALSHPPQ